MPNREISQSNQDNLDALEKLGEKLKSARTAQELDIDEKKSGWAIGVNYASAFVGSVVVAGGIGYGIDHFAGTKPWGLSAGIVLGFMAGTRSIVRMARKMSEDNT